MKQKFPKFGIYLLELVFYSDFDKRQDAELNHYLGLE
jgi:hypothetical protein